MLLFSHAFEHCRCKRSMVETNKLFFCSVFTRNNILNNEILSACPTEAMIEQFLVVWYSYIMVLLPMS